jgi:hypothetical protein
MYSFTIIDGHEGGKPLACARGSLITIETAAGPKGRSEFRSLGQAEAYPTKSPAFLLWGKL